MLEQNFTRLTVIRHGETEWNKQGRLMNQLDSPLTELGKNQASCLASRLAQTGFDMIYSSDLGRAVETAKFITDKCGGSAIQCPLLREQALGIFQGLTWDEVRQSYPTELALFEQDVSYIVPDGESMQQFHQRVIDRFQSLASQHPNKQTVVVTHGGVLDSLIRFVMDIPLSAARPARLFNASINIIDIFDQNWMLSTWGDISHLQTNN